MNTTTRTSKIARLPHSIREQLNLKLHDNVPAKSILPWLNSLPETKAVIAADFDNRPVTKQNLSDWKQGGFRDWLLQFRATHFLQFLDPEVGRGVPTAPDSQTRTGQTPHGNAVPPSQPNILPLPRGEGEETVYQPATPAEFNDPPVQVTHHASRFTSKLLLWTQLQYIAMARDIDSESDPDRKWKALRQFSNDIARLERSDLARQFLQIQREWLALSQSNSTEKKALEFCKWIKRPDIADALKNKERGITQEFIRKFEEDNYLNCPDDHGLEEHIARVRLARELMARRKAKETQANRKPGDPVPEAPDIKLRNTTFEELFPTPDLYDIEPQPEESNGTPSSTQSPSLHPHDSHSSQSDSQPSHPSPSDQEKQRVQASSSPAPIDPHFPSEPSDPSYKSDRSDSVQPSPAQSSQIQPDSPPSRAQP